MIEGRQFHIFTDHKPLIYAFRQKLDKSAPCQIRQLDFISQYTTDIRHISGTENITADLLSRINSIDQFCIDFEKLLKINKTMKNLNQLLLDRSLTVAEWFACSNEGVGNTSQGHPYWNGNSGAI